MSVPDWSRWAAARPSTELLHLDTAAVGRPSVATLEAVAHHARWEAEVGGYVAEAEAQERLTDLRHNVAGLLGTDAEGVAFVESGAVALEVLVDAWPLVPGARVGVAAAEWGPNLEILRHRGLRIDGLAVDGDGVLDLDDLETRLRLDPPDLLLLDQVAAHRGLVQPAQAVVALGRAAGVPVWIDAAQTLGHLPVAAADASLATSRKWLGGPRGVGMLAVAETHRTLLRVRRPAKHPDRPTVRNLESEEAHVAGRVGLGVAVLEHLALGQDQIAERLVEVGRLTREAVSTIEGWEVVRPDAPAGATTAVRATRGQDVERTRMRLLEEHAILTSLCLPWRAPGDVAAVEPWLRLSPHVDLTADDLERVCGALTAC